MDILMHMCCAPCAVYPVQVLQDKGFTVKGLFFNPNIHPKEEYDRRRQTLEQYSKIAGVPIEYIDSYMQSVWETFGGDAEERCEMCYSIRLQVAAKYAKEQGFRAYTTSLLVSPYQKHELIKKLGEKYAFESGVEFYYDDFRVGFREGQNKAKEMGLYRQKHCGCIISYNNSDIIKKQLAKQNKI